LTQNSSTSNVISQQSSKMIALEHTLGNKHWRRIIRRSDYLLEYFMSFLLVALKLRLKTRCNLDS
jgi:urease accessory protein UreE